MKKTNILLLALLCLAGTLGAQNVWDAAHLSRVKQSLQRPFYAEAYQSLLTEADDMLSAEPLSVMMKASAPISGDMHDYMSLARYFWPDPSKPDGLPYVNRDGVSNPELELYDRNRLGATTHRVTTLALAWYFSGDERYAQKATELLRTWFLDKKTRMNPHLEYAQVSRGHHGDKGRCYGIIDSYGLIEMLDGVALLENSRSFTRKDSRELKAWFGRFLQWLLTSEQGKEEDQVGNNHSVAYDAQVIAYSLYTGRTDVARRVIEAFPERRVFTQIAPDGSQPHELGRTLALHYSQYNLAHFIDIYRMAQHFGHPIDQATSADGRNFYKAMDFLASYVGRPQSEWPYQQISGWEKARQSLCREFYRASLLDTTRADYLRVYHENRRLPMADRFRLLYVEPTVADDAFAFADGQLRLLAAEADRARKAPENAARRQVTPRSIKANGELAMIHPHDWCSGFFAGSLWQMYEYTHEEYWRRLAITWTWPIEEAQWHRGTHDLGFMMYDSFGHAYDLIGEQSYKDVVIQSARTLITRFNPTVGCIRSWDHNSEVWHYPVIIDNLMNLELLFRATQLTGDSIFWNIALRHADTTLKHHFRPDYSSYHVVDYDPSNGSVRMKQTAQGYADDSFWSRGQAWGAYGYTTCYRFTGDRRYLQQAEAITDFMLGLPNMPADGIPYWDMKMESVNDCTSEKVNADIPRDASAAAILASALYELQHYVSPEKGARYRAYADKVVDNLHRYYQAPAGTHRGFLLLHSTGHHPGGSEIDVPLNYADYFYLEACQRRIKEGKN